MVAGRSHDRVRAEARVLWPGSVPRTHRTDERRWLGCARDHDQLQLRLPPDVGAGRGNPCFRAFLRGWARRRDADRCRWLGPPQAGEWIVLHGAGLVSRWLAHLGVEQRSARAPDDRCRDAAGNDDRGGRAARRRPVLRSIHVLVVGRAVAGVRGLLRRIHGPLSRRCRWLWHDPPPPRERGDRTDVGALTHCESSKGRSSSLTAPGPTTVLEAVFLRTGTFRCA